MGSNLGDTMKKCPLCFEEIQDEAIKCKHCGSMINGTTSVQLSQTEGTLSINNNELTVKVPSIVFGVITLSLSIISFVLFPLAGVFWLILGTVLIISGFIRSKKIECPHCSHKREVINKQNSFKCHKCRKLVMIDWTK